MKAGRTECGPAVHHEGRSERAGPSSRSELDQHASGTLGNTYVDEAGPTVTVTACTYWTRGARLEGVKEHSPRITGGSVDDTSMNWGFSFRKSFNMVSARSACGVTYKFQ